MPLMAFSQVKKPMNDPGFDNKLIHFGFSVGLNTMDYSIKRSLESYKTTMDSGIFIPDVSNIFPPGFQVQIISDLKLGPNLNLRFLPGISFGQRAVSFYHLADSSMYTAMNIGSAFLDFPLHFKYRSSRLNNYRPYIIGGLNYRYDMSSRNEEKVYIKIKPGDLYFEMGIGIDWYLQYFKLSTEIKAGVGLFNLLIDHVADRPEYQNSIEEIRSYIVNLSFHFE